MPRTCKICSHPDRPDIDAALLRGEPFRHISSRVTVSTTALQRHKRDHIPAKLAKAPAAASVLATSKEEARAARLAKAQAPAVPLVEAHAAAEEAEADTLYEQLKDKKRTVEEILDLAMGTGKLETALRACREARDYIELEAKMIGQLDESTKIAVGVAVNTPAPTANRLDLSKLSPEELQQLRALVIKAQPTTSAQSVQFNERKGN